MNRAGRILLLAGVWLAQVMAASTSSRALERASSAANARIVWSEEVGRLENGDTYVLFTALSVADPTHLGGELRGVWVNLAGPDWKDVVYVEESEIAEWKKRVEWLAKMAKTYPNETGPFVTRRPADDPPFAFSFSYQGGPNATVYLEGLRSHQPLAFPGAAPSEVDAIFARAVRALKRR